MAVSVSSDTYLCSNIISSLLTNTSVVVFYCSGKREKNNSWGLKSRFIKLVDRENILWQKAQNRFWFFMLKFIHINQHVLNTGSAHDSHVVDCIIQLYERVYFYNHVINLTRASNMLHQLLAFCGKYVQFCWQTVISAGSKAPCLPSLC